MKPILFILPNLAGGGAERATLEIVRRLDRRCYQPMLALLQPQGEWSVRELADVPVATGVNGLVRLAWRAEILVGGLELTATYWAVLLGLALQKPVIGWVHTHLELYPPVKRCVHRWGLNWLYPHLRFVVAVSESVAEACRRRIAIDAAKVKKIDNPMDLERLGALAKVPVERLHPSRLILGIGKLDANKDFATAVRMLSLLVQQGVDVHLVVLGIGPERDRLGALAVELGVADRFFLPGFDPNPYRWLQQAEVLVLPSQVEGLSTVMVEALLMGRPVVSTDCPGGLQELGLSLPEGVVPVGDAVAMARALRRLLEDPLLQQGYAEAGAGLTERFRPERILTQWQELLESCAKSR